MSSFLMVGCGNSKMSEEMSVDGYPWVTNIDIAPVVVHKMRNHYGKTPVMSTNEFGIFDATRMNFRDNSFDFCVDKGTFDALACG
jgi:EEF1A lysine methyltransferase 4